MSATKPFSRVSTVVMVTGILYAAPCLHVRLDQIVCDVYFSHKLFILYVRIDPDQTDTLSV